jgi:hypothetical protein
MEPTERDALRLLAPLRDAEPPGPSTVDVSRAVRTGARRVRVRQVMTAAVAAVVTGLAVVAVPMVINRPQTVEPARPAAEFPVLRQQFTVGSAGGYTPVSYETGRYRHRVELGPAYGEGSDRATVTMYPRGRSPWNPGGEQAEDVNGHKAFWVPNPVTGQASGTELAWEWSDGAWGFAYVNGVDQDARHRAHVVAESVAGDTDVPVTVPFTIPAPADPLRLLGVITPYGTSSDRTSGALLVLGSADEDRILVGVQRDLARDLVAGQPRNAPAISVAAGAGYTAIAESDQSGRPLAELAGSVRLVQDPADLGSWVSNPIR